jgi:transcriptional regulator with XRE-family HTH domain
MPKRPRPTYFRDPPLRALGERLRAFRTAWGWTQNQLGVRAQRHWTFVSQTERGERNITHLSLLSLANALEVDPGALVTKDRLLVDAAMKQISKNPKRRRGKPR